MITIAKVLVWTGFIILFTNLLSAFVMSLSTRSSKRFVIKDTNMFWAQSINSDNSAIPTIIIRIIELSLSSFKSHVQAGNTIANDQVREIEDTFFVANVK